MNNSHSQHPTTATWRNRVLGSTSPQRFDRYTRASTAFVLLTSPFLALTGLAQVGAAMPGWVVIGFATLVLAGTIVAMAGLGPALDCQLGRRQPSRGLWGWLVAAALVPPVWALALIPLSPEGNLGSPHAVAIHAALPALSVLACLLDARRTHALVAATVVLPLLVVLCRGLQVDLALALTFFPAVMALALVYTCRLSGWMLTVMEELEAARATSARLAVAEERLRFSRDLHDVVGRSMSAVALKSQLAAELSRRGRHEKAQSEMEAVHGVAQEALAEMRAVVAGYRRVDLVTELVDARRLLENAGVDLVVSGGELAEQLDPGRREALGWVVREGVTNVVRHAHASWCRIDLRSTELHGGDRVELRITNDVPGGTLAPSAPGSGSGLKGLSERLAPWDGSMTHGHDGGCFVLAVSLPRTNPAPPLTSREGSTR